ncbi:uncharacterized protein LOC132628743 [Lycium barbarum]|uniref:uncharacterized protein LOC132628743 n=1 Tax=Lycium barbarum TaxID=112863 RepID=UPI00293E558B|nr:uncharacterized protein LOC132628743 [Lycium barbarum]
MLQEDDDHEGTPIEEVEDNQGKERQEGTRPPESNTSVILPVEQEADLSPRSVQKLKQATNKQKPVRSTRIPVAGVSTRRSLMEPFQDPIAIEEYRRNLGFQNCKEREELWEDMVALENQQDLPWIIGGDFNVIVSDEEKQGGHPIDVGLTGSKFTWWNGRTEDDCIFKRNTYGNIFQQISTIEDTIKVKEFQFKNNASRENRMLLHQAQAELTRFLHLEEEYWKQKAGMKWFNDGDRNTKFFHPYMKGRRNKLTLKRIQDPSGGDYALLKNLPKLITEEQQKNMEELPSESEVKEAVFSLNGDSASGPDGFTGQFYQKCWEVIKLDVIQMVRAFFCGCEIPQFITHTNLVLLPKKEVITTFSDMRPISLSSFSNKILSKILQNRLAKVLPNIISHNQTRFVKGRSIAENILLAQEIIRDINLKAKHTNVVIKLDMAKEYDRLSWICLTKVLRQFGFGEGVKQGDPLSPTLFIIAAEVLTRSLNKLHEKPSFIGYGMPKWSPQINHLLYADDTILFCSGDGYSLKKMMRRLRNYEESSGQLVNTDKSCYYFHHKVSARVNSRIKRHTKMRNGSFPFTYLGCPVFYGRRKLIYYEDLIKKVMKRILSWQNRLLSFGGRYVLVNHVLQTMPVYLLSAMNPPSGVIKQLHKIFAKFFWSNTVGVKSKHWVAWDKLCLPKDEGGIGLRSLTDISKALFAKLWWNFRCGRSLWGSYMLNKYCQKWHPIMAVERGGSHTWKKMTRLGALYYIIPDAAREEEIEVRQFVQNGEWNMELLTVTLDQELAQHIKENIKVPVEEEDDEPCWMLETNGKFSVKSAWEFLRHRESKQISYKFMWEKGLPIKISFFMWRVWKGRISTNDILKRMMINIPSRCWYPTDGVGLHQMIMAWWSTETKPKLQPIYRAMPAVICGHYGREETPLNMEDQCPSTD